METPPSTGTGTTGTGAGGFIGSTGDTTGAGELIGRAGGTTGTGVRRGTGGIRGIRALGLVGGIMRLFTWTTEILLWD